MFDAPAGDWRIVDVLRLADRAGLKARAPNGGSHYTFSSPHVEQIQTVPYKRPIRSVYIKKFAVLVRQHLSALEENDGN